MIVYTNADTENNYRKKSTDFAHTICWSAQLPELINHVESLPLYSDSGLITSCSINAFQLSEYSFANQIPYYRVCSIFDVFKQISKMSP